VGSFAVGAVVQADICRYAKDQKGAWIACIFGYVFANSFMVIAGVITAMATGSGDLPEAMIAAGMNVPALVILIAAQWTTNDNNLYSASLALSNLIKVKKSKIVFFGGVGASILGSIGIVEYFIPWLSLLGILIPPIAGVMIADYYVIHRRKYHFGEGTKYSQIVWPAFAAWACGIIAAICIPLGVSSINAIVVAFAANILLTRGCQRLSIPTELGIVREDSEGF
jgi:cytosine permease